LKLLLSKIPRFLFANFFYLVSEGFKQSYRDSWRHRIKNVQEKLNKIRSFGDEEFADLLEHNVRYYLKHGEKFNYDPDELIEWISEILWDVKKGLKNKEEGVVYAPPEQRKKKTPHRSSQAGEF
jgi:hypothetical protein